MAEHPMLSWSTALVSYAEPLIEGCRVAVIGNSEHPLPAELIRRGAREVHVYDPEPRRAKRASKALARVHVASLNEGELALREGAFDVAIVEDAGAVGKLGALLQLLRQAISSRGAVLICAPNPDARARLIPEVTSEATVLDYYTLYDVVTAVFPVVRMLGQAPFVGYAIVDFAPDEELEPSLDTSLIEQERAQPEQFVALASASRLDVDAFSLIEVPFEQVANQWHAREEPRAREPRGRSRRLDAGEERARIRELEEENRRLRSEQQEASLVKTRELTAANEEALSKVTELEAELARKEVWIGELEARAETADARADATLDELAELQTRLADLEERAQAEKRQIRAEAGAQSNELKEELAKLRAELKESNSDQEAEHDIEQLEAALRAQGQRVRHLERELATTERTGRQLLAELDELAQGDAEEPGGLAARREADLIAAQWVIEHLRGRLEQSSSN